jgi:hypothetical protein
VVSARLIDLEKWASLIDVQPDGCWRWTGYQAGGGYGYLRVGDRSVRAHRWAYRVLVRDLPDELHLDHICHDAATCDESPCLHRLCVNPLHLEPVTQAEHNSRPRRSGQVLRDACRKGHTYAPETTIINTSDGYRSCRTCAQDARRRRDQR